MSGFILILTITFGILIIVLIAFVIKHTLLGWSTSSGLKHVKREAKKLIDSDKIDNETRYYKIANYLSKEKDDVEASDLLRQLQAIKKA